MVERIYFSWVISNVKARNDKFNFSFASDIFNCYIFSSFYFIWRWKSAYGYLSSVFAVLPNSSTDGKRAASVQVGDLQYFMWLWYWLLFRHRVWEQCIWAPTSECVLFLISWWIWKFHQILGLTYWNHVWRRRACIYAYDCKSQRK